MSKVPKIFPVGTGATLINWMGGELATSLESADLVAFPGGADVNPMMYGEPRHPATQFNEQLDKYEIDAFRRARDLKKRLIGICRGAQLLCVQAGGRLVQHQGNIHNFHDIMTYDGRIVSVSSDHHQAMYPWKMKPEQYAILGWSIGLSRFHLNGHSEEVVNGIAPLSMEIEAAFFPEIKALCLQPHPEWQYNMAFNIDHHKLSLRFYRDVLNIFMEGHDFKEANHAFTA